MFKLYLKKSLFWFSVILFLEVLFMIVSSKTISYQLVGNVLLSTLIYSQIISLLLSFLKDKPKRIITIIILVILAILFGLQIVFYNIFKVYFSFYNLALTDQVGSFLDLAITLILKNSGYIILVFIPLISYVIYLIRNRDKNNYKKRIEEEQQEIKIRYCYLGCIILSIIVFFIGINMKSTNTLSNYNLYHNVNNVALNIKRLGVLNSYSLELKRIIFGFTPKKMEKVVIEEKEEIKEIVYKENKLDLNFKETGNPNIQLINDYINSDSPTLQNEYTGMFKGYNLIYITAESFSEIGIDENLTPTLYRLTHSGFVFKNFYTPNNLSTIGGEFQSLTGLYPDYSILKRWRDATNYFPYGLAYTFRNLGYSTNAYHNNSFVFQDRHQYLASQGFNNFLACYNGLERRMNCGRWPQSDDEMIEVTVNDYIHNENPFLAYYMTVSGHFGYTFVGNSIASKNRDLVSSLDKSESAKAYVATQIELDRALNRLLTELENNNKLDNTVIVLLADHYPYELDNAAIDSLSGYHRDDIEINHNALIIWNNQLETKEIEKPCMSTDVIPTVYNLFGIDYDSRLFSGRDILSTSFGLSIFTDQSWITDKGKYIAPTGEFIGNTTVEEDYVNKINQIVNNRKNIARMIMENDYYRYLFG